MLGAKSTGQTMSEGGAVVEDMRACANRITSCQSRSPTKRFVGWAFYQCQTSQARAVKPCEVLFYSFISFEAGCSGDAVGWGPSCLHGAFHSLPTLCVLVALTPTTVTFLCPPRNPSQRILLKTMFRRKGETWASRHHFFVLNFQTAGCKRKLLPRRNASD